jgi:hypothetical protein
MDAWKAAALVLALAGAACAEPTRVPIEPVYDSATGRLTQLAHDTNHNGVPDTWTEMDGTRPRGTRADGNEDGRIDRWEYYDPWGTLVKVGFSRKDDGKPDGWAYSRADGSLERIELSSSTEPSRIGRWEFYERPEGLSDPVMVRAEEDANGDGRADKWEAYEAGELASVAWDVNHDGVQDRRITYKGSRPVLIETAPDEAGQFTKRVDLR